ncbi:MAG: RecX family transcriptional regulator [Caldilineaceae bacterium]|nr:RecX family transcriptional regulator [Caldilineaceae bacterium]
MTDERIPAPPSGDRTITAMKVQKKNKERVNIFLDDKYAFAVGILTAATLRKGQVLSAAEVADLRDEGDRNKAYHQALRFLGYRPRSVSEVTRYLKGKEYAEGLIADVTAQLAREGYLSDEEFARFWVENRLRFRPRSARALRYELRQKGVDPAAVDAVLQGMDEAEAAWDALQPKLAGWSNLDPDRFRQKAMGLLSRRGFSYGIARTATDRAWDELENPPD